ncbi:E3 ubiquitin-protein ligase FANCL [Cimex lectularius]|uniref:RING-type domain-containing protein n=1 Tax=Cimex lectularius TaxID=79782 RepID=A0A8I6S733_CIMLE|nr:E3 ubiquitin-protein ligase FANCL [Cimex lectularius]
MEESIGILLEYPLIVPSKDFTTWEGFIKIKREQFPLTIFTPEYPSVTGMSIHCPPEVTRLINPQMEYLLQCSSLSQVLNAITHLCKLNMPDKSEDTFHLKDMTKRCKFILGELKSDIEEENIEELDEDLQFAKVSYVDSTNEKHQIKFSFTDYPKMPLVITQVDVPSELVNELSGIMNFRQLYQKFTNIVEHLIPFWTVLKDIDSQTWVIDPQHPQKRDGYRRIFLEDDLSVIVTINPLNPTDIPDLKFLGAILACENKRRLYFSNLKNTQWNNDESILENLKVLLELKEFPSKPKPATYEGMIGPNSCSICFSDEQEPNQSPPTKWCNNPKCNSRYHLECILQWFESRPNVHQFFTYISGPCPYCEGKVLCPVDNNRVL